MAYKAKKRYRQARGLKFSLSQRLEFVEGLYSAWLSRERLRLMVPIESLDGNIDVLSELIDQEFSNVLDMKRKVRVWIQEMSEHLDKKAERDILLEKVEK